MEWLRKLSAAIDYIENHLDGDISYDEAAKIACCSTFYFQRVFSYVAGVSLSEYMDMLLRLHLTGHFRASIISHPQLRAA